MKRPNHAAKVKPASRRIALVTEELCSSAGSGGIGGAFHELAIALAKAGHAVDIVFMPADEASSRRGDLSIYYSAYGIRILEVPYDDYVWPPLTAERRSYALFCFLRALETGYDFVHFHDYKGIGYFALAAKQQRLAFAGTVLVVQAHGPTRWTLEANGHPFSHEDQLKIDFMERESFARADLVVSPSRYLLDWIRRRGWKLPPPDCVHIIQNVCMRLLSGACRGLPAAERAIRHFDELVFFGRHEERKGIVEFCDALDRLADDLAETNVTVTFLGRFGEVNSQPSALYLAERTARWRFPLRILPDFDRDAATAYLAAKHCALVVIPSRLENSPYAVLEAIVLGKPLITSDQGGAAELLDRESSALMTCRTDGASLAEKLRQVLRSGLPPPRLCIAPETTEQHWLDLHRAQPAPVPATPVTGGPRVAVAIVHHDRPEKLVEAVLSIACQTYKNLEIVVIDDGSEKPLTQESLRRMTPLLDKLGVRLIRQPNLYLGAARNRAVRETSSDYLLFLDDDDIAFPTLVQTLVTAAEATGAVSVNSLNLFMDVQRRDEAFPFPDLFSQKVSYVPLGGPLSMAPLENCFGSATSLIRRDALISVGGYTEQYGVGHEDYELYVRLAQSGARLEVCPIPLYLYEVGRPSMISTTSRQKNFNRVVTAIDPGTFTGSASIDLCSLLAGRRAAEHTVNFRAYSIRISPVSELLRQIIRTPANDPDYPELIARYANAFGAERYAAALQALSASRAAPGTQTAESLRFWAESPGNLDKPSRTHDPLIIAALADVECGRHSAAAAALRLSFERGNGPDSVSLRVLMRLAEGTLLNAAETRALADAASRFPMRDTVYASASTALLRLAMKLGDEEMMLAVADRVLAIDERAYLAAYPDVAEAVRDGAFSCGLLHFVARPEERRTGFTASARLCALVTGDTGEPTSAQFLRGRLIDLSHQQSAQGRQNGLEILQAAE